MAKIVRKNQKVFGSNAGLNQIAQFGSLAENAPAFTTDPDVIQDLAAYIGGWFSAVIGANSPAIEDMNALCYLFARQIAYCLQTGVGEWDTDTTYYIGSIVNDGTGQLFVSLTDDNQGNALTDETEWIGLTNTGTVTPLVYPYDMVVAAGTTRSYNNLTIPTGKTWNIESGAAFYSIGPVVVDGTIICDGTIVVI